jgi:poly-gamma-glutamate synthesis protein (capsule biosynthesis protein)
MLFLIILLSAVLFSACGPAFDYVAINSDSEHEQELMFIETLFRENAGFEAHKLRLSAAESESGGNAPPVSLYIEIVSSWEFEDSYGDILISRTFHAPREDPLAARTDTSLAACLDGTEDLVPLAEIEPPFTALRVDGLALGDEAYPLVRMAGIHIRAADDVKISKRLDEKLRFLVEALEAAPKTLLRAQPQPLWIVAGGDLMLDRGASEILFRQGPAGIFGGTAAMLESADLALVNLEGVISRRGERVPKSFNFRFVPEVAPALKNAGIDAVLHANNHIFDYGEAAFLDSLSWLAEVGIGVVGAGHDIEEASQPFVFKRGDDTCRVFGIASFPRERNGWDGASAAALQDRPGMLHAERGGAEKLIAKLSPPESDALDIILFHGGVEWSRRPDAATRKLYTDLISAGADLIIGSHPHIVQGFEWVHGKPVFWSLGNYVFGGMENTEGGEEGLFIRLGFLDGRPLYMEPFALTLTHTRTGIAPPEKLETFYTRSRELSGYAAPR